MRMSLYVAHVAIFTHWLIVKNSDISDMSDMEGGYP